MGFLIGWIAMATGIAMCKQEDISVKKNEDEREKKKEKKMSFLLRVNAMIS